MPRVCTPEQRRRRLSRRRFLLGTAGAIGGLTVVGAYRSNSVQVVRQTIPLKKWGADGFRVAQISDIHLNNEMLFERAKNAVHLAIAEKPDLIVFTGDCLNVASPERLAYVHKTFQLLEAAQCPCYGVLGNHDYYQEQEGQILDAIDGTPLQMLRNEIADVDGITLVGLDDAGFSRSRPEVVQSVKHHKSLLVLLHEPDFVKTVPEGGSLMLSGHSHGGEVCLPGGAPIHTPYGAKDYWAGYYPHAKTPLFVNKGIATLGPLRVFCPPEVTVLTLRQA